MQITTKGELVVAALRKLGVASDATLTDIEPQSLEDGVVDLESMMYEWFEDGAGIHTGYKFADEDTPIDQGDEHGLNKQAINAVIYNLATRIAPDYQISPLDKVITTARYGKERLMRSCALKRAKNARSHHPDGFPIGSGNRLLTMTGQRYFHRRKPHAKDPNTSC
ncbi:packaged DNA stabilization gp4 family protein [Proteus mirabilis]|uniref:packaged DNA stabilization gp4 family protein n=1 Tax=Proteus mirabilis TaxID=584 RepID=UPI00391CAAC7